MEKLKNSVSALIILLIILLLIGGFWLYRSEKEIPLSNNDNKTEIKTNINKTIDTSTWTDYANNQLGFSIKIPLEVPTLYRCPDNKQMGSTPLRVFEDNQNGAVYISQEYYYDANWSQPEQRFIGECSKIIYSLESLKKEEGDKYLSGLSSHPFLGWKIIINNPKNDDEIVKFVKQNFGPTCTIGSKDLQEDGNYKISIKGEYVGENLMDTNCLTNFVYKILYSPAKGKLMSVIMGQECTLGTDPLIPSSYQCYDEEMIKSFRFEQ